MPTVKELHILVLRAAQAIEHELPANQRAILNRYLNRVNDAMCRDFGISQHASVVVGPGTTLGPSATHVFDILETALS